MSWREDWQKMKTMTKPWPMVPLGEMLTHRKEFIQIDDAAIYKRCRVKLHAQGIVLRDEVPGIEIKTKKQQVCRAGEFLVAEIDAKVGGFGIVPDALDAAIVSSHYFLFQVIETALDKTFLDYFIRTPFFRDQVTAQGSTNYAAIRPKEVLGYKIPLPPLSEQKRIVGRIEELAAKIEEAKGLRQKAAEEDGVLISSALSGLFAEIAVAGILNDVLTDKPRNGWSARCDNTENGVPVLSLSAVTGFQYRETEFKKTSQPTSAGAYYWLKEGDVLITRSNTPELVGHAAIYNGKPSPCIYPDLMMKLDIDELKADKLFVHKWLSSTHVRDYIRAKAKGTSPTMKKISQGIVMNIPFPSHIPLAEQRRIVAYLDNLQAKVDAVKDLQAGTAAELDAMLPSVLDRAFKGEL